MRFRLEDDAVKGDSVRRSEMQIVLEGRGEKKAEAKAAGAASTSGDVRGCHQTTAT